MTLSTALALLISMTNVQGSVDLKLTSNPSCFDDHVCLGWTETKQVVNRYGRSTYSHTIEINTARSRDPMKVLAHEFAHVINHESNHDDGHGMWFNIYNMNTCSILAVSDCQDHHIDN